MVLRGSLETINLADIFQNLAMNQQTGTLTVSSTDRAKCIYFQRGEVRYLSHGKRKNVLLGEMLIGRGLATGEQVDAALAEQQASGHLLGEIVVDLGICSREDMDNLVRYQIEEEIYDLFGWQHAEFEFREGPPAEGMFDPEQQATELSINTSGLIMEAARRIDEWERIRQVIPAMSEAFVAAVGELGPDATPEQRRIFSFLDGTRDADAVVDDSFFSRYEVASCLMAMVEAGSVRRATSDELKAGAAACLDGDQAERAARLMETALTLDPDDPAIREQLADALIAQGQREKGAIHLSVLGDARANAGDVAGAIAAYERIVAILPGHATALEKLARIRSGQRDNAAAVRHYVALVQSLLEAGRLDEAAACCREGLRLDIENAELRSALAKVLLSSGDREGAIEEYGQLAEVFARAGQAHPAAETFRRILQIDPRNKYARKRLVSIQSGAGVVRKSHRARNIAVVLVVAILLGAGYFVYHELKIMSSFQQADEESPKLVQEKRFDEARRLWQALAPRWSLLVDCRKETRAKLDNIDLVEEAYKAAEREKDRKAKEAIAELYESGMAHVRANEIEKAREALLKVIDSEHASEEMKDEARTALGDVEAEAKDVGRFVKWHVEAIKRTDRASLEEELAKVTAIYRKYPGNPALAGLKRPLIIATKPPGAGVFVDGVFRWPAPPDGGLLRIPVASTPLVRAELAGYTPVERAAQADALRMELVLRRKVAWKYDAGTRVFSLASGPGGMLLVANQDAALAAVDPGAGGATANTRKAAWPPFRASESLIGITSGITVRGEAVYFGTDRLYSLEPARASWRSRWVASVGGRILAPVTVGKEVMSGQHFVFGTCVDKAEVGVAWAVESSTGEKKWERRPSVRKAKARCRPLLHKDNVYVSFADGQVYSLNPTDGLPRSEQWSVGTITELTSPAWDGRHAWVGTGDGRLCGFDLEQPGNAARSFDVGRGVVTDVAISDGVAYLGDERGVLHAVALDATERPWRPFAGEGRPRGMPAVGEKRVYFATDSGRVYAVDRESGKLVWQYALGQDVCGGVFFDGKYLYAGGADGYVYAFDEKAIP